MNTRTSDTRRFGFALPEDEASRDRLAELGQLASGLVHELKNPLGALDLNLAMLQKQYDGGSIGDDKTGRRLERLAACSEHLHEIIQAFLNFARPGKPQRDRVDINKLLDGLIEEQREILDQAGISVHAHFQDDLKAVAADPGQLRIVFLNIILNARDALLQRDNDRNLAIFTRNRAGAVNILIGNNGPPLSDTAATHLFDAFYSDKEGGTGLGLAIVRRLVELHEGRVSVQSDPNQGVSFTIELPTALGPAKPLRPLPLTEAEAEVRDSDTDRIPFKIAEIDDDRS